MFVRLTNQARVKPASSTSQNIKEPIPALSNVMDTNEHVSPKPPVEAGKDVASA